MNTRRNIYAVVPVKDTSDAKRRLAGVLNGTRRQQLALAMCEDVLATLAGVRELAGIVVVTVDPAAAAMAARYGAHVSSAGAREGHTGAVAAAARELAREGMLTVPADIPLVEGDDIRELIHVHRNSTRGARAFTIVPARMSAAPTPFSAPRPAPCRCASAPTASSRISPRPSAAPSSRRWCACRASRSISTRPTTWPNSSLPPRRRTRVRCSSNGAFVSTRGCRRRQRHKRPKRWRRHGIAARDARPLSHSVCQRKALPRPLTARPI